jgi:hypothetical protein
MQHVRFSFAWSHLKIIEGIAGLAEGVFLRVDLTDFFWGGTILSLGKVFDDFGGFGCFLVCFFSTIRVNNLG